MTDVSYNDLAKPTLPEADQTGGTPGSAPSGSPFPEAQQAGEAPDCVAAGGDPSGSALPDAYAAGRPAFDEVIFEDEAKLERRIRRRRKIKRIGRKCVGAVIGFGFGILSSYTASIMWDLYPATGRVQQDIPAVCPPVKNDTTWPKFLSASVSGPAQAPDSGSLEENQSLLRTESASM